MYVHRIYFLNESELKLAAPLQDEISNNYFTINGLNIRIDRQIFLKNILIGQIIIKVHALNNVENSLVPNNINDTVNTYVFLRYATIHLQIKFLGFYLYFSRDTLSNEKLNVNHELIKETKPTK